MNETFTFNYEVDGKTHLVEVEYNYNPPSETSKHLLDSDQDYSGWVDILSVFIVDEETNQECDFDIPLRVLEKELEGYLEYTKLLAQEEQCENLRTTWSETDLDGYTVGLEG